MKKTDWKSLRLVYGAGEVLAEKEINLDKGERIVAGIATNFAPGQHVALGLYENGNEISAPMHLDFWRKSNSGHYLDGFKPIEYKGGSQVTVRLFSPAPLAGADDLEVEIVFGIIKEDTTC